MASKIQIEIGANCPITNFPILSLGPRNEPRSRIYSYSISYNELSINIQYHSSLYYFLKDHQHEKNIIRGLLLNQKLDDKIFLTNNKEVAGTLYWESWASQFEYPKDDIQKFDFTLSKIYSAIGKIGGSYTLDISIYKNLHWEYFFETSEELEFMIDALAENNLLKSFVLLNDNYEDSYGLKLEMTYEGLLYLNQKQKEIQKDLCFVAMSFGESEKAIFTEAIEPAVKACGYQARKVDDPDHHIGQEQTINDAILALAKKANFVICDYTGNKRGVYFEHGYAWGMGKKVIMTVKESEINDLHFDVSHYPFIVWKSYDDLKERLKAKIESWIGMYGDTSE